ncbi:RecQ family ATP-dependent DNA helicase [Terrimonas sp. NA20]|uniref:ATP-dependent DNA helicase RecQ n=1 Tax=Terrimonas ginsenosidimutans TaxID=2908004 RepID=A0ABS9KQG1_9BACT|nr:ATP-dependent DNA helicase RecQ [Terrimonas ginsenosidimutans]MCG2614562.1 RecQ family ATP-dependent DNA helicase [Terrimonas ginsenosidimutans]
MSLHEILKEYWGYDQFRPLQQEIMQAVLDGKDSLALMPTGGGKSLCYQVPAMAMDGACLVVSPLIALMKDQVESLRRRGITAFAIYSGMKRKEVINTLELVTASNCKFLYVSPERLETSLFKEYLPGMNINLVAVDEAHCVSQWGYDFRPSYLRIAALREELREIPILALTASATPDVQQDIIDKLQLKKPAVFRQSFERPNLSYSVFEVDSKINKAIEILSKIQGTSIVYCKSRKRTQEISDLLQLQGISSDYYHAGLSQEERSRKQEGWIKNTIRVIVCTNAFGMGIDKPDVRTVIHADIPDCLENYYQEAGRAGRDGKPAFAVLLYSPKDLEELQELTSRRFPTIEEIRQVYQSVANYLQLEAGTGLGNYYDFDLADFSRKFKHDSFTSLYALKTLEQEGWLSVNEQVFLPSTVQFNVTKSYLYEFEESHPALDLTIKALLRTYEGIFDYTCFISELLLAQLLNMDQEEVKRQLKQLDAAGIIIYSERKDTPQIYFLRNRVRTETVTVNQQQYQARKETMEKRIRKMMSYVQEESECRSKLIGVYFGDREIKECGICDNCLKRKRASLTSEEFSTIHQRILNFIQEDPVEVKALLEHLQDFRKEKAWKVIEFMQAEDKLQIGKDGRVRLSRR